MTEAVFAIPGDHTQRTGGYIYEATVLGELNALGCATELLSLPGSFPDPTSEDMVATLEALSRVPANQVIILDGFLVGSLDPEQAHSIKAPMLGVVHHPLGLETGLAPERAAFLRANEAAMLCNISHVMVPSPHTAKVLSDEFGVRRERITIALPGVNMPMGPQHPLSPPLLLSVGLLAPRKGHDVLLNALHQLTDLPWQAEIVGKSHDPAYESQLLGLRSDLGLEDRVKFLGEIKEGDLSKSFRAASVFCLASHYEGYGMVLSEAIMHGLPIVSCRAGAIPDTVGDAGLLATPGDASEFATLLRRLLTDGAVADRLRLAAIHQAKSLPKWSDTAKYFADCLRRIAAQNR
ncbi:MAG: glycosyltransferase family 4 protein [Pseudomonadota bacterium]